MSNNEKRNRLGSNAVVFATIFVLAVASINWIILEQKSRLDSYVLEIEADYQGGRVGGRITFPSSSYELLQSSGPQMAVCESGDHPVDLYLYQSAKRIRHFQFCPDKIKLTPIDQKPYIAPK